MNDKHLIARIFPLYVLTHYRVGRTVFYFVGAHRQKSIPLLYDYYVIIFINELHPTIGEQAEFTRQIDLYLVSRRQQSIKPSDRYAIYSDLIVFKQLLDIGTFTLRHGLKQEIEQPAISLRRVYFNHIGFESGVLSTGFACIWILRSHYYFFLVYLRADFLGAAFCSSIILRHSSMVRASGEVTVRGIL